MLSTCLILFLLSYVSLIATHPTNSSISSSAPSFSSRSTESLTIAVYPLRVCDGTPVNYTIDGYGTQLIIPPSNAFIITRALSEGEQVDFSGNRCKPWISSWNMINERYRGFTASSTTNGPIPGACNNIDNFHRGDGGAGCLEIL